VNNLKRELAPVSTAAWRAIDEEARRVLKLNLAGRKLVDFKGPLGPTAAAVNTGRVEAVEPGPLNDVQAARRQVLPLVQLRTEFELDRAELESVERGAPDPELGPLIAAAKRIAHAEDSMIFHGYAAAGIEGIEQASPHPALKIAENYQTYPRNVAEATRLLRMAGVDGPYGIALGPRCFTGLMQATGDGGYPVLNVIRKVVDGPLIWAPAVNGAIVMSTLGDDLDLTVVTDL
jgi:uncharacterized linocin/CFP29 family protein